jgi:hypothetical protein
VTDASTMKTCPDCGARVGEKHKDGCDVERCPHCGGQALGCIGFDPNDPRRQPWDGKWPGEADCERLGFFVNGDRSPARYQPPVRRVPLEPGATTVGARSTHARVATRALTEGIQAIYD